MTLKEVFEDKLLKEEYMVLKKRKKIGGEFRNKWFIKKQDGEVLGRRLGYETKEEAIKDLLFLKDKKFNSLSLVKQKEKVNRYIKQHKL